ncbi:MAG TPA: hypothetical protein VNW51_00145 [Mucilaginibacter sp.]|jgi:hypothetical protein|nr:hypothetical protein [Mucilaginibacter sp.]
MEDLINTVAEKTGISPDQARTAITAVIDHLKDKLPLGLGDKIESFIGGQAPAADGSAPASGGGLFDDLKDKLSGGLSNMFS